MQCRVGLDWNALFSSVQYPPLHLYETRALASRYQQYMGAKRWRDANLLFYFISGFLRVRSSDSPKIAQGDFPLPFTLIVSDRVGLLECLETLTTVHRT